MELGGVLPARRAPVMGARRRRSGRRGARGTLTRPRDGVATASQQPHSESSRQEEPPSGGSTRLSERKEKREASAGERGAELASAADAYAPAALDCGAAADLPRGRPRKLAGVSSAARVLRTSKPRLSVPSRAGAASVRTRPARKTQGRCREQGPSGGGAWGTRGGARPGSARDNPEGRGSTLVRSSA